MRFRILGPLEVEDAGRQLELGGPRQRAVLAFLLLNANQPVPVARLLDALWDGSTAGARNSLHSTVSRLRQPPPPFMWSVSSACGRSQW